MDFPSRAIKCKHTSSFSQKPWARNCWKLENCSREIPLHADLPLAFPLGTCPWILSKVMHWAVDTGLIQCMASLAFLKKGDLIHFNFEAFFMTFILLKVWGLIYQLWNKGNTLHFSLACSPKYGRNQERLCLALLLNFNLTFNHVLLNILPWVDYSKKKLGELYCNCYSLFVDHHPSVSFLFLIHEHKRWRQAAATRLQPSQLQKASENQWAHLP